MGINRVTWRKMFDHVITPTLNHLVGLLEKPELKGARNNKVIKGKYIKDKKVMKAKHTVKLFRSMRSTERIALLLPSPSNMWG